MQLNRECSTKNIQETHKSASGGTAFFAVAATVFIATNAAPALCTESTTISGDAAKLPKMSNSSAASAGDGTANKSKIAQSTTSSTTPPTTPSTTAATKTSTTTSTTDSPPTPSLATPAATSSTTSASASSSTSTIPAGSAGSTTLPAASTESTSPQPATSSGFKPWLGEEPGKPSASAPPKANKPADIPPPPGMDAATKLFKERKWALAQKSFEGFISSGKADVQTHQCLAYCYYYQRIYSKALVQFEWVAKNAQKISEKSSAENTARVLRCYRAGICPANCLKPNDPRWARAPGREGLWITFHYGNAFKSWSEHHVGELITYVNGEPENQGTCPTCSGLGTVKVLKDGAPAPTQ